MEKDFDFNRIGKRMPYKTPEGFFDEMESNVWAKARLGMPQTPQVPVHKASRLRIFIGTMAVAASIALLLLLAPFSQREQVDGFDKVEQAFACLSQADQAYMLEVYQEDVFMDE